MKDNLGNKLNIGDYVFCLSGYMKNRVQRVEKYRIINESYGEREAVDFGNGSWLSDYNTISLNALGIVERVTITKPSCDAFGKKLNIGDKVLFLYTNQMYCETGIVKKMTPKSCLLEIEETWDGKTEYRKKCEELISLSAIGKSDWNITRNRHFIEK